MLFMISHWISYFSLAVRKYCDPKPLRGEEFILAYGSRALRGREGNSQEQEAY